ncbi:MAG TPA: ComEC/Rec2 family competence protein, partial [Chitinophagales bacterium]|nr:ComEC/Rec2 family competence protein [Chitinophagales bacterium]
NVSIIWIYAVLTGLSASVLRSAVMFTFVAMGSSLKRITNIYNVLASSAFFLLLINPYFLMEVGFQLSYLAVLGIVLLQPRIYPLFYTRYLLLDKIWMITAVSIAAQAATFPLGLLYYYQFPVYFLVSNLFVIPASTLVLYLGLALFALFWMPRVSNVIGLLLDKTIWFMDWVVLSIDSLPFALLQGISISVPESWFIYLIIAGIVVFFYYNRNSFFIASLAFAALLLGWNTIEKFLHMQQKRLIIYSVPNTTAMDFISGCEHLFVADSSLLNDYDRMLFHIKHNWWDSGLRSATAGVSDDFQMPFLKRKNQYIQFLDKRMVLLDKEFEASESGTKLKVDFIILSKNVRVKMEKLAEAYDFGKIIFDSSNSGKRIQYWKKDCERLGIGYWDVNEQGAFVEEL